MNTEIYIENQKLDVSKDISTLLNFSIDDVANFAERSTSWSKTIVLPGTANNNRLFGHIFEIGHSNMYNPDLPNVGYNFNAAKGADCIIFQDNIQTFKGVFRLLEIISENGQLEYECQAIGELAGLNVALTSGKLEDLDFSEYDHVYNHTNIINSWDNVPGSGYYYPLIDYGNYSTLKQDWDIRTFRPALYVKEYIDKMFEAANYRYNSALFGTDRFKRLVIPQNKKTFQQLANPSFLAENTTGATFLDGSLEEEALTFNVFSGVGFTYASPNVFYNENSEDVPVDYRLTLQATLINFSSANAWFYITIYKGDRILAKHTYKQGPHTEETVNLTLNGYSTDILTSPGDNIQVVLSKLASGSSSSKEMRNVTATLTGTSAAQTLTDITVGGILQVNYGIPSNIRQIDFLMSIVKLFNLYVYEDRFDSRLIHITPFVEFFSGEAVDWTYKLNRNKPVKIKPMSQLTAKIYEFKYKSDSDYFNDLYKKRYGEDYGNRTYDSEFEFTAAKKSFEVIFSPTPLSSPLGEDKIISTIYKRSGPDSDYKEESMDSNIRILQTKKITGVTSWEIRNGKEGAAYASTTSYGYAGHLDDPDAPSNDLNFGAPAELFFTLASGDLSVNQFNVYWSPYMAEITDKDSKLLTGKFYLTPKDIAELDFSKYIFLDGNIFRLNSIKDYNMSEPSDCEVELLKVINTTYTSSTSLLYVDEGYVVEDYVE